MILDFSHPDCLPALLSAGLPLVIGTTGYSAAQQDEIRRAAGCVAVFQAANFSPGVYALGMLLRQARALLPDWEAVLIERHHAGKKDSPSGTALRLAEAAGLQSRQIHAIRAGTVRGAHELTLYGPEETLTLLHNGGKPRRICPRRAERGAMAMGQEGRAVWDGGFDGAGYDGGVPSWRPRRNRRRLRCDHCC